MRDQQKRQVCLAACLPVIAGATLLLAGCGDGSVSGTYVSHNGNSASLLQLTETPDHHFTGTLRRATLNNDGTVNSTGSNVSGSVDKGTMVLTVLETPLPIGQNISGTVSGNGLDFTVPANQGSQTATAHFDKGDTSDYDSAVAKLTALGGPIIAQRQREQRVQAMDADVNSLVQDLAAFIARAHEVIGRTPTVVQFYPSAVLSETDKLGRAQRLMRGSQYEQGQAQFLQGQMQFDQGKVQTVDDAVANATRNSQQREATLDAHIAQYQGNCLGDGSTVNVGDAIPDQGPCKTLTNAVRAYRAVVPQLHQALTSAGAAKADGDRKLAMVWKTAADLH